MYLDRNKINYWPDKQKFQDKFEEMRLFGVNVINSDENLTFLRGKDQLQEFQQILSKWNVRVVLTYRR